jgi:hypothetical protein
MKEAIFTSAIVYFSFFGMQNQIGVVGSKRIGSKRIGIFAPIAVHKPYQASAPPPGFGKDIEQSAKKGYFQTVAVNRRTRCSISSSANPRTVRASPRVPSKKHRY